MTTTAPSTLQQWLAAKPFTLTMSSGFFGFFAHCGMLSALEDQGLTPQRITGSSAGALIGGLWASGLSAMDIIDQLKTIHRDDFWDPKLGLGLLQGQRFQDLLHEYLQVESFSDCRIPLSLSVFNLKQRRTEIIHSGLLAPAIQASCCVPGLFHPVTISQQRYLDGGITDRPGLASVSKGERVFYHHLASRSPWRGKNGAHTIIPQQTNMQSLVIHDLPRPGPFHLANGPLAWQAAREQTQQALAMPLTNTGTLAL